MEKYDLSEDRYFSSDSTVRNYTRQIYESIKDLPIISPMDMLILGFLWIINHSQIQHNCF